MENGGSFPPLIFRKTNRVLELAVRSQVTVPGSRVGLFFCLLDGYLNLFEQLKPVKWQSVLELLQHLPSSAMLSGMMHDRMTCLIDIRVPGNKKTPPGKQRLLLISINCTPKTSHSCLKKWHTMFSRGHFATSYTLKRCNCNWNSRAPTCEVFLAQIWPRCFLLRWCHEKKISTPPGSIKATWNILR